MMKSITWFYCFLLLVLLAPISGCQAIAQITPPPTNTLVPPLPTPTATKVPPSCPDASSFGYFTEIYPRGFELKTTSPDFEWWYSFKTNTIPGSIDGWADVCVPDSYTLYFSTGPNFTDEISVQVTEPNLFLFPNYLALRWVITPPLAPLQVYRWVAVGHYGSTNITADYVGIDKIPQLHNDSFWPPKNTHRNVGVFKTGPICDPLLTGIGIPALNLPADGETINSLLPTFTWDVSICMPDAFNIQIYKMLDPQNPPACQNSNDPADFTICINQQNPWLDMQTNAYNPVHLLDCTSYSWRVRSVVRINETNQLGEWSELRSFFVDTGACPTPTPTFVPWTPTPPATLVPVSPTKIPIPTKPPFPTVPPPVVCASFKTKGDCDEHPDQCYWYDPGIVAFPYCKAK